MIIARILILLIFGLVLVASVSANNRSSSLAISPDGLILAAVNSDSRSVTLLSLPGEEIIKEIFVGRSPQSLAFDSNRNKLFVANRLDDSVSVIDLESLQVIQTLIVPDEPFSIVVDLNGTVFVACMQAGVVAVLDPDAGMVSNLIETENEPHGLALSQDQSELLVTHFSSGRISFISTGSMEVEQVISTGADTNLTRAITLSPDGKKAYIPQTRSNVTNEALLFDTTLFPIVSVIDLETRLQINAERIHLDISDEPVNMPFDVAFTDENTILVLNSGSNDISVINLQNASSLAHVEVGNNPRSILMNAGQDRLYVNNALSGTLSVIDTASFDVLKEIEVTDIPLAPDVLNGKIVFHRSDRQDLARDQWISCASCHFEGEMDGRTWFFPDGPRNTTSLLGVADTLPVHWSGDLDELQDVEITVRDIQAGTGLAPGGDNCTPACDQAEPNEGRSQDLDDLAAYMATLNMSPNPNLEDDGSMSKAALRGKGIFESEESQCSSCHLAPLYSDGEKHDVGTGQDPNEKKGSSFDTPSLRGIYKTAPYLHHGKAGTLIEVLTMQNPSDLHGKTSHLTEVERSELVAFLNSVGSGSVFQINAGLNDAWVNIDAPFQGMFVTVFPESKLIFLAWFTFDTVIPSNEATADFGAPDQRWLTAVGSFDGSGASLKAELTSGGIFNASIPLAVQTPNYGTITIEFTDCRSGFVKFDFPAASQTGEFAIARVLESNVGLCEELSD